MPFLCIDTRCGDSKAYDYFFSDISDLRGCKILFVNSLIKLDRRRKEGDGIKRYS